ncbi:FAD:protein FMN transferase [Conexibacter sp. W3-3-2]|uniref:FAD:protein FMN transferase n=1 Tax=Conexibacter sp. W3-3-2 TaxID=2675227 RepID=UPI0012B7E3E0|nr:FAD:protein FMN transferase [Conexibacter sp. W3-3-2]MTD45361.1 FAD:protein FMN transferase [Conexibacter sp. W3-3-2]
MSTATAIGHELRFPCFGGTVGVRATGAGEQEADAAVALERARALLLEIHDRLTRFEDDSELSHLNADPRERVPASPLLRRFAAAVREAGERSDGLVDATCLPAVEAAGYREHLDPTAAHDPRAATAPTWTADGAWRRVGVDGEHVVRPVGVRLDSGGIGKGLAADLAGELLAGLPAWAVDCGGDLRIGGSARVPRSIAISDPFHPGETVHELQVARGAVATSGTTRRAWTTTGTGADAHHLVDPRTGRPADTGVVQVTALAPTALEAEVRAKTALLLGPARARRALPHGGVVVTSGGDVQVVPRPVRVRLPRPH